MRHLPDKAVVDNLVAENVFFAAGHKEILKGVTIRADKGSVTGLLGRNGSGKSTMLQAIYGTLNAQECTISINGTVVRNVYSKNKLVNYLPQKPFLPPALPIHKILQQFEVNYIDIVSRFPEVENDLDKKVNMLSGGSERLWSVLVMLMADTRFTMLDEPFTHIMPLHIERLKELITECKAHKGIIITDHMYRHLLQISDSLYLMKEGKSIFIKDKQDIVLHGYLNVLE